MLKRFALWLCRVAGVPATQSIDSARLFAGPDAVARGQRWDMFYREAGGLADMLEGLRREAFEAAAETDPREIDLLRYWLLADRNIRKLQQRIEAVVITGKLEDAANQKRTDLEQSRLKQQF